MPLHVFTPEDHAKARIARQEAAARRRERREVAITEEKQRQAREAALAVTRSEESVLLLPAMLEADEKKWLGVRDLMLDGLRKVDVQGMAVRDRVLSAGIAQDKVRDLRAAQGAPGTPGSSLAALSATNPEQAARLIPQLAEAMLVMMRGGAEAALAGVRAAQAEVIEAQVDGNALPPVASGEQGEAPSDEQSTEAPAVYSESDNSR